MAQTIQKIKIPRQGDNEIINECKKEVDCGACSISWTTPPKGTQMEPTVKTLFVVVDVPKDKGAIRVFEKGTDKHIGTVGTENAGHMVIIPWDDNWWFRVSGSLSVGYIEQQGHSQ